MEYLHQQIILIEKVIHNNIQHNNVTGVTLNKKKKKEKKRSHYRLLDLYMTLYDYNRTFNF